MRLPARTLLVTVAVAATTTLGAAPALASGQAYPGPGFTSASASCIGAGLDFTAHYGPEGSTWPTVVHGTVGPEISGDASGEPGVVGAFTSAAAQQHGSILTCFS